VIKQVDWTSSDIKLPQPSDCSILARQKIVSVPAFARCTRVTDENDPTTSRPLGRFARGLPAHRTNDASGAFAGSKALKKSTLIATAITYGCAGERLLISLCDVYHELLRFRHCILTYWTMPLVRHFSSSA
jgi:hypothetical protein